MSYDGQYMWINNAERPGHDRTTCTGCRWTG